MTMNSAKATITNLMIALMNEPKAITAAPAARAAARDGKV